MTSMLSYIIPFGTFILGILVYDRSLKKDSERNTRDMATLITKVDMLLTQSNSLIIEVKEHRDILSKHNEKLVTHDVEIKDLRDTIRFKIPKEV